MFALLFTAKFTITAFGARLMKSHVIKDKNLSCARIPNRNVFVLRIQKLLVCAFYKNKHFRVSNTKVARLR